MADVNGIKELITLLKEEFSESLKSFRERKSEEEREALLIIWEDRMAKAGLPNREKANLVVLLTMLPLIDTLEEQPLASFLDDFYTTFFVLLDDAFHPNS